MFAAKPGDIVGPVQTDFGWHIIKVNGVQAGARAAVRRGEGADRGGPEARSRPRRNSPPPRTSSRTWSTSRRTAWPAPRKALEPQGRGHAVHHARRRRRRWRKGNAKFVQALFSPESIQGKRNTEAIEVGPNTLIAGADRRIQAGGAAPVRRGQGRDPRAARAQGGGRAGAGRGPRETRAAEARARATRRPASRSASRCRSARNQPQPGFPPEPGAASSRPTRTSCRPMSARRTSAAASRSTRCWRSTRPATTDKAKVDAASARLSRAARPRDCSRPISRRLKAKADVKINQANLEKK